MEGFGYYIANSFQAIFEENWTEMEKKGLGGRRFCLLTNK